LDDTIREALDRDRVIDITTTGRRSGQPRLTEIWYHRLDGRYYLTGTPGPRSWYANLLAHPRFTFHLKESVTADLPARAIPITDPARRRAILERLTGRLGVAARTEDWIARSPLVEVRFDLDDAQPASRRRRGGP